MSDDEPQDLSDYQALSADNWPVTLPDERLAARLREVAEHIMLLEGRFNRMPRGPEKFKLDKILKQVCDHFCAVFNHNEVWHEYRWADGLTVRFIGPTLDRRIIRGRVRPEFSWDGDATL